MKYIVVFGVLMLAACSSTPKLSDYEGQKALERPRCY
jgi:hypothetical protein